MRNSDYYEVLPQLLGITFALVLLTLFSGHIEFLYGALFILFGLIIRLRILIEVGKIITLTLKTLGNWLTIAVLATVYVLLVTPYAFLFRLLSKETVLKFFPHKHDNSSTLVKNTDEYSKEYFSKPW